jgi:hypothetical protein
MSQLWLIKCIHVDAPRHYDRITQGVRLFGNIVLNNTTFPRVFWVEGTWSAADPNSGFLRGPWLFDVCLTAIGYIHSHKLWIRRQKLFCLAHRHQARNRVLELPEHAMPWFSISTPPLVASSPTSQLWSVCYSPMFYVTWPHCYPERSSTLSLHRVTAGQVVMKTLIPRRCTRP